MTGFTRTLVLITALTFMTAAAAAVVNSGTGSLDNDNRYIVMFDSFEARDASLIEDVGGSVTGGSSVDLVPVLFVNLTSSQVGELETVPGVELVEKDRQVTVLDHSSDHDGSFSEEQDVPWGVERINGLESSSNVDESGIIVTVLDTGIDHDHEDLSNNIEWNYDAVYPYKGEKDEPGTDTGDGYSHGTHVAGTVAAENNGIGVVGIAPEASIYNVKVLSDLGPGSTSDVIDGLDHAVKGPDGEIGGGDGSDIISMSFGSSDSSESEKEAIAEASKYAVLIAGAGNDGDGDRETNDMIYPALYEPVLSVGAVDRNNQKAGFSSEGEQLSVSAPGTDIYSTLKGNEYGEKRGTSMATPHVSGLAANIIAEKRQQTSGEVTNHEVWASLMGTTKDLDRTGHDRYTGKGLVQGVEAVRTDNVSSVRITRPYEGSTRYNSELEVRVSATSSNSSINPVVELRIGNNDWKEADNLEDNIYGTSIDTRVEPGDRVLHARASVSGFTDTDQTGLKVQNEQPDVYVEEPDTGDTVKGKVKVEAEISDREEEKEDLSVAVSIDDGEPEEASFNQDTGYYEYVWDTTEYEDGEHKVEVIAEDTPGATDSSYVEVVVSNTGDSGGTTDLLTAYFSRLKELSLSLF